MTDERIIAYLLEELPKEERERFEDECFSHESWPVQIALIEEDLIDDYLRDELAPERRRRFEENYLTATTPARWERFRMAAALLRHVDEHRAVAPVPVVTPTGQTWAEWFRAFSSRQKWAFSTVMALALVAVIATPSPQLLTLNLLPSSSNRAEGARPVKVKLPRNDGALKVFLTLPEGAAPAVRYRVTLVNDRRETELSEIAVQDAQTVSIVIPAEKLASGRYALKLFAINTDGTEQHINNGNYYFTVE